MAPFELEPDSTPLPPLCATAQEAMVEAASPWSEEVTRHIANCPACREFQLFVPLLQEGVAGLPIPTPSPISLEQVLTAVTQDRQTRSRRRRLLWIGGGFAIAASLLIAVVWIIPASNNPSPAPSDTVQRPTVPLPPDGRGFDSPTPGIHDTIENAKAAVALKTREAEQALERTLAVLPNPMGLTNEENPIDPALKSLNDVGNSALSGFQPLTASTKRAFGMMWKELAPDEPRPPAID